MPDLVGISGTPASYKIAANTVAITSASPNAITCTVSVPLGSAILFSGGYTISVTDSGTPIDPASSPIGTFTVLNNGPSFNSQSIPTAWTVELYNPTGWFSAASDPTVYAATLEVNVIEGVLWAYGSG